MYRFGASRDRVAQRITFIKDSIKKIIDFRASEALLPGYLTFIKDSIKKSIALEHLELCARIVVFLVWGSVATCLTFVRI